MTLIYAAILFVLAFCGIVGLVVVSQAMVDVLLKDRPEGKERKR